MRGSAWMALAMTAAALAACSPKPQSTTPAPVAPVAAPPATAPASPAAAAEPPATPPGATAAAAADAPTATPAPPSPDVVRFSPGDYPAQERRIDALIANAVSRDTTGDTQQEAAEARAQRARCATKACIKRSYAAEEAKLRRWDGSADVN